MTPSSVSEDGVGLLVEEEVARRRLVAVLVLDLFAADELRDDPVDLVVDVRLALGRARDDERRPRLVDEDGVDLVDDREDVPALDHLRELELHVVAQVVEAELVVRAVRDVAAVGVAAVLVRHVVLDAADRKAEELVDPPHPLGVALGEVVVDGDDVDAASREGVQRHRERRDERLAFARPHLGDLALVEDHAAHELDVVVALADGAPGRFADEGERLDELLVQRLAREGAALLDVLGKGLQGVLDARADRADARAQLVVGERLDPGLERVDLRHAGPHGLHVALVLRAEDFREGLVDDHERRARACTAPGRGMLAEEAEVRTRSTRSRAGSTACRPRAPRSGGAGRSSGPWSRRGRRGRPA